MLTVGQLGERGLIDALRPYVTWGAEGGILGVGDDCALLPPQPEGARLVLTTDLLVEGTHFIADADTNWNAVGHKAASANLSDLASMGAQPVALLVSLGLPGHLSVDAVKDFYAGLSALARRFQANILGGDVTRARQVTISITAVGSKLAGTADCLRSDARPGDYLYVSGALGGARAGVDVLTQPDAVTALSPAQKQQAINRHFCTTPRVTLGAALARLYDRVAMVDISDGLYNEAGLLASASDVEIALNLDTVPVDESGENVAIQLGVDPQQYAFFSGEEYELLFALPVAPNQLADDLRGSGVECAVTCVGTVNPGSGLYVLKGGHPVNLDNETFVHFR